MLLSYLFWTAVRSIVTGLVVLQIGFMVFQHFSLYLTSTFGGVCQVYLIRDTQFCTAIVSLQASSSGLTFTYESGVASVLATPSSSSSSKCSFNNSSFVEPFDISDVRLNLGQVVSDVRRSDLTAKSQLAHYLMDIVDDLKLASVHLASLLAKSERIKDHIVITKQHAQKGLRSSASGLSGYLCAIGWQDSCVHILERKTQYVAIFGEVVVASVRELSEVIEAISLLDRNQLEKHFAELEEVESVASNEVIQAKMAVASEFLTTVGWNSFRVSQLDYRASIMSRLEDRRQQGFLFRMALDAQLISLQSLLEGVQGDIHVYRSSAEDHVVDIIFQTVLRIYDHLDTVHTLSSRRLITLTS
ncbi:hypothetical protein BV25DRAFT_1922377 [Artomyces pyxidatus]|uniref:Uncharacterized protein n=1 Tax=Artomyces pyxidatus TaxID=48021 RepID=A0ACB8SE73_9AGAM|nr:hypothetical protein BV25DRAFT_1922377 [Artomyces pyxidatus]